MSADNWACCPKCKRNAEASHRERLADARAAYGKEPPEEYERLMEEAKKPYELTETLREEYYIGLNEAGEFVASYTGHCRECGFEFEFKHKQQADLK